MNPVGKSRDQLHRGWADVGTHNSNIYHAQEKRGFESGQWNQQWGRERQKRRGDCYVMVLSVLDTK